MKYIVKKLITLIITLFVVSFLAFLAFQVISGDAATSMLGTNATPEQVAQLRAELGLDRPVLVQYGDWLGSFLQGDMGTSYTYNIPVRELIAQRLPVTALLTLMSFILILVVSFPLGLLAAEQEGRLLDRSLTISNQIIMSIPPIFVGILLSFVFGEVLRVFVPGNFVSYKEDLPAFLLYMLFPAISIALPRIAMTVKMLRSSVLNEMGKNYIYTAYSRGHSRSSALVSHALPNAMIPVVAFLAVSIAEMVAASIIVEQIFSVPGIGRLLLASISNRDVPVVQAIVVILAFWVVAVNFIADILYQYMDPRVRLS